jgi:hypothetical protein
VPGALTLIGGAIILAAVMGHGLLALRQARAGGARSQARAGGARRRI